MQGFLAGMKVEGQQFSQPPIRSYHFWAETLFLLMVASEAVFLAVFCRLRLCWHNIFIMGAPVVLLAILWFWILQAHQAVHDAYERGRDIREKKDNSEEGWRTNVLLGGLAKLSYFGFAAAATAVAMAYLAFLPSLLAARRLQVCVFKEYEAGKFTGNYHVDSNLSERECVSMGGQWGPPGSHLMDENGVLRIVRPE